MLKALFIMLLIVLALMIVGGIASWKRLYDLEEATKVLIWSVIAITALCCWLQWESAKESAKLKGEKYVVTYEYVNVRQEPGGEVLYQLDRGEVVTLTGEYLKYDGGAVPYNYYVQLKDGNWVVMDALEKKE